MQLVFEGLSKRYHKKKKEPNGTKNAVGLFLGCKDLPSNATAKFTLSCVHQKGGTDRGYTQKELITAKLLTDSYGTLTLMKQSELLGEKNGFIVNDRVIFQADVTVIHSAPKMRVVLPQHLSTTSKFSLKNDLSTLLDTSNYADVTIKVADGAEFRAHKFMLSARSKVFQAMLNDQQMIEAQTNTVSLLDVDPAVFEQVLKFMYTDECDLSGQFPEALLPLGDRFDIPNLVQQCANVLSSTLSVENVCSRLMFADTHGAATAALRETALCFAAHNFSGVQLTSGFLERLIRCPDLLAELFTEKAGTRKRKRSEDEDEEIDILREEDEEDEGDEGGEEEGLFDLS